MSKLKNIAIITSTRADYGLLRGTIDALIARGANVQLLVTGTHLSQAHGYTAAQIEADGYTIATKILLPYNGDTPRDLSHTMAACLSGVADALASLRPDCLVCLGDRYEMLAAASAATMMHVPIAHIHGGEITEGAMDDALRHAITKLAYWHIASAAPYAARIVQLGEDPARVFTAGAPGIDQIAAQPVMSRSKLAEALGITLKPTMIVATFHPETLANAAPEAQVQPMLDALATLQDTTVIITGANADAGGDHINSMLQHFASQHNDAYFFMSLGSARYMNAMRHAHIVLGNSSSGVIEAPVLGRASINIGDRQTGRLRAPTVIDCENTHANIARAITKALSKEFQATLAPQTLFGTPGNVSAIIADYLLQRDIPEMLRKTFIDRV